LTFWILRDQLNFTEIKGFFPNQLGIRSALLKRRKPKFQGKEEVSAMNKSVSLPCNLILSLALLLAVPSAEGEQMISSIPIDDTEYCHLKFSAIREANLPWERPVFDFSTGNIMDFYDPCDHGPLGSAEIPAQKHVIPGGNFDDGNQKLTSTIGQIREERNEYSFP
jgi:hypothetical protein